MCIMFRIIAKLADTEGNCTRRLFEVGSDECACLFNHNNNDCTMVAESLGLNCTSHDATVVYILQELSEELKNDSLCVLETVCRCLKRDANHSMLEEIEETCRQFCPGKKSPVPPPPPPPLPPMLSLEGDGEEDVCRGVHNQYCRRHMKGMRRRECAAYCVQENDCVSVTNINIIAQKAAIAIDHTPR